MKVAVAVVLIVCFAGSDSKPESALQLVSAPVSVNRAELDLCDVCVQFTGETVDQLLNIILNVGVVGGCNELCGLLNASQAIDVVCNLLCDIVGIKEFINLIQQADLDPIYFCELLKTCQVFDEGDANITALTITPKQGPAGTDFVFKLDFETKNGTGTGQVEIDIDTVDGMPVGDGQLMEPLKPGAYSITFKLNTNGNCNQEPCESWEKGTYNATLRLCNGECGSKHPHSGIYDTTTGSFEIAGRN